MGFTENGVFGRLQGCADGKAAHGEGVVNIIHAPKWRFSCSKNRRERKKWAWETIFSD